MKSYSDTTYTMSICKKQANAKFLSHILNANRYNMNSRNHSFRTYLFSINAKYSEMCLKDSKGTFFHWPL